VRSDELIDNVARDMTAMATRPALRERVLTAAIADARQPQPYAWGGAAVAAAACLAVAAWLLMPSRTADEGAVATTARHDVAVELPKVLTPGPVAGRIAEAVTPLVAPPPTAQIEQIEPASPTRPAEAIEPLEPARIASNESLSNDGAAVAPLLEPAPIVVQAITISNIAIAPPVVSWIEVQGLSIEPLRISSIGGT